MKNNWKNVTTSILLGVLFLLLALGSVDSDDNGTDEKDAKQKREALKNPERIYNARSVLCGNYKWRNPKDGRVTYGYSFDSDGYAFFINGITGDSKQGGWSSKGNNKVRITYHNGTADVITITSAKTFKARYFGTFYKVPK